MKKMDDIEYIVYGSVELPCDVFVEEGEIERLRSIIESLV